MVSVKKKRVFFGIYQNFGLSKLHLCLEKRPEPAKLMSLGGKFEKKCFLGRCQQPLCCPFFQQKNGAVCDFSVNVMVSVYVMSVHVSWSVHLALSVYLSWSVYVSLSVYLSWSMYVSMSVYLSWSEYVSWSVYVSCQCMCHVSVCVKVKVSVIVINMMSG